MSRYTSLIYPKDDKNQYPKKLIHYIFRRFFKTSGKILDVGCSKGTALKFFNELGNECYGVDLRSDLEEEYNFKCCDLEFEKIPYKDDTFDYVYSKSVLEHVNNSSNFLSEIYRVLKPGGTVVLLTPDWTSQMKYFWDDYTHIKAFTRKSLRDALYINGFDTCDCEYFYQLPFVWNKSFLKIIPKIISVLPDFLKWKDKSQRNTKDRKLIRFSKEKMLLSYGIK